MAIIRRSIGLAATLWLLINAALLRSVLAQVQAQCPSVTAGSVEAMQGTVEIRRQDEQLWRPANLNEPICPGDSVRVGEYGRAALALEIGEVLRLDQNTTIRLLESDDGKKSLLDLVLGVVQFFSNQPKNLDVRTPFLNAGVEGTEFLVRAAADETFLVVFQGRVNAANPKGQITLGPNQAVLARVGATPVLQIPVAPRETVRWALFYPPVQVGVAMPPGPEQSSRQADSRGAQQPESVPPALREAQFLQRQGRLAEAIVRLGTEADPLALAYRAGLLLSVGRRDEARRDIDRVLALNPRNGEALALSAIIAIADNDSQQALEQASRAVEFSPRSAPARIALSYAYQAGFDLGAARDQLLRAVEIQPDDALAWARLSEIQQSLGYRDRALEAAQRAAILAPNLGRTQSVLGFAALAALDTRQALEAFGRAIPADQADPLAQLGLGLALIRNGDLAAGRQKMEIAAMLDPGNALVRSYLGKAYFEERRDEPAAEQLTIAKELDEKDPTAWFYDAIRKQTGNRPVEALEDLEHAIAINDNRAVYRSRLLLDEDLAGRSARLGTIYRDLGFEQLALVEGWRSVHRDPTNHSTHRLLADTYLALPRHEIARDSELLQSQLLQPLNIQPVQPRLAENELELLSNAGPADVGLNEYAPLFTTNRVSLLANSIIGDHSTFADDVIVSGIYNNYSLSVGQSHYETDGLRQNNDLTQDIYDIFGQVQITPDTSVLAEFRQFEQESGDRDLRFDLDNFFSTLRDNRKTKSFRIGGRHSFAPNSTLIGSYTFSNQNFDLKLGPFRQRGDGETNFMELRHILQGRQVNMTGGFGYLDGQIEFKLPSPSEADIKHNNGYFYSQINVPENMIFTLGISIDEYNDLTVNRKQVNPKAGLIWNLTPSSVLRAAVFRTLKRTLISSQTIEPTQVAGFNQFFDDVNGTDAWRFGIGFDQKLTRNLFAGGEISRRDLTVPVTSVDPELGVVGTEDFDAKDTFAQAYLYWTPTDRFAVSAEYRYERLVRDLEASREALAEVTTHKIPLQVGFFHPSGLFARTRATFVDQSGRFESVRTGEVTPGNDRFWVADMAIGYRFPERRGLVALEVRNLFDHRFNFQDVDPSDPTVIRERTILGRLVLRF